MNVRGESTSASGRWAGILFLVAAVAVVITAFSRIHTYVTGQDPRTYIVLARQIADDQFAFATIREVARFISPGYPLLLATVVRTAGVEAAFFANTFLFAGVLFILNRIFRRITGSEWQAGLMMLACLGGLLAGYPRNAHFLLLAFRNTPAYLFMAAALLAILAAHDRPASRFSWPALVSALLVMAGTGLRETVILLVPAILLFALCAPRTPDAAPRRVVVLSFLLPFAIAAGALLTILALQSDALLNSQSRQVLRVLPYFTDTAGMTSRFSELASFTREEAGIAGLVLMAAGLWFTRRRPALFFLFAVPAITFFVFYGFIKVHRRFFLTAFFFMLPVAAFGLTYTIDLIRRGMCRISAKAAHAIPALASVVVLVWCLQTARELRVWGERVTAHEIHGMQAALDEAAGTRPAVLVDARMRYLIDALTVFTGYRPLDAAEPGPAVVRDPPHIAILPLNKAAVHPLDLALDGRVALERNGRVEPTGNTFALGNGHYELVRVLPWSANRIETTLPPPPSRQAVLRLTAPDLWSGPEVRTFIRVTMEGETIGERLETGANYLLIDGLDPTTSARLAIESDQPIPEDFHPLWQRVDDTVIMDVGAMDTPSHDHFLSGEFFVFPAVKPYAREVRDGGTVRLPFSYPANTYLITMLGVSTVHDEPDVLIDAVFSMGGIERTRTVMKADAKRMNAITAHIGIIDGRRTPELDIRFIPREPYRRPISDERGWNIELHNLILYPTLLGEPLTIDLGTRRDTPYLNGGFWQREALPEGTGRWTEGAARLHLPLQPGHAYTLTVRYHANRAPGAPEAKERFMFNEHPLDIAVAGEDTVTATIPADWVTAPSNALHIAVARWKPSDYLDTRDERELGIFLKSVDVRTAGAASAPPRMNTNGHE